MACPPNTSLEKLKCMNVTTLSPPTKMVAVYIVVENGVPYPVAYPSFESAVAVAKEKHKETLEEQIREADGGSICSDLDVPENKLTGHTYLYVEKEIHIRIYRLPCM